MKRFKQWEFAAIPLVIVMLGVLFILFAAFDAGPWAWLLVGAAGLVVCLSLVAGYARRHRHPDALDAPRALRRTGDGSIYRVLVVADDACPDEALRTAIGAHAGSRATEAFVVAPAVGSRLARWTGDQRDYDAATERLEATLHALENLGIRAQGRIGSKDPIQATDDGLRQFAADEIVLALHSAHGQEWLEQDAVAVALERYDVPVTPIIIDTTTSA